jgi:hypothetical protein
VDSGAHCWAGRPVGRPGPAGRPRRVHRPCSFRSTEHRQSQGMCACRSRTRNLGQRRALLGEPTPGGSRTRNLRAPLSPSFRSTGRSMCAGGFRTRNLRTQRSTQPAKRDESRRVSNPGPPGSRAVFVSINRTPAEPGHARRPVSNPEPPGSEAARTAAAAPEPAARQWSNNGQIMVK